MENLFFKKEDLKYCGSNVIIGKTVRIRKPELVYIDDNTIIDDYTYISGEVIFGKYIHIGPSCSLQASVSQIILKDFVGISAGTRIYASSSDYLGCSLDFPTIPDSLKIGGVSEKVIIHAFSIIGANSVILPGCILPIGFSVGTHARLTKTTEMKEWSYYDSESKKLYKRIGKEEIINLGEGLTGMKYK